MYRCKSCLTKTSKGKYLCSRCSKKKMIGNKSDGFVVYGLYNLRQELLYIGVSCSAKRRVSEHSGPKDFHKMEVLFRFESGQEAYAFEAFAINHLRPILNKKIEPLRDNFIFDLSLLDKFGTLATEKKHTCITCGTVLSRYNTSIYCSIHTPKRKNVPRKPKR